MGRSGQPALMGPGPRDGSQSPRLSLGQPARVAGYEADVANQFKRCGLTKLANRRPHAGAKPTYAGRPR